MLYSNLNCCSETELNDQCLHWRFLLAVKSFSRNHDVVYLCIVCLKKLGLSESYVIFLFNFFYFNRFPLFSFFLYDPESLLFLVEKPSPLISWMLMQLTSKSVLILLLPWLYEIIRTCFQNDIIT